MYQSSFCSYIEKKKKKTDQSNNSTEVLAKEFAKYLLLVVFWADEASIDHEGIPSHDLLQLPADVLAHDVDFHLASTKRNPFNLSVTNSRPKVQIFRCHCEVKFSTRFRPNEPLRPRLPSFFSSSRFSFVHLLFNDRYEYSISRRGD